MEVYHDSNHLPGLSKTNFWSCAGMPPLRATRAAWSGTQNSPNHPSNWKNMENYTAHRGRFDLRRRHFLCLFDPKPRPQGRIVCHGPHVPRGILAPCRRQTRCLVAPQITATKPKKVVADYNPIDPKNTKIH